MSGSIASRMLFSVGVMALVVACGSKLDKVRDEFIDSCTSSGGQPAKCECAINKLQAHYGVAGLIEIQERGFPPPDFSQQLAYAGQQCRYK